MLITMTMSPYRDPIQFVLGPIHEYMHAYQTAYGYQSTAEDSNQMGHVERTQLVDGRFIYFGFISIL